MRPLCQFRLPTTCLLNVLSFPRVAILFIDIVVVAGVEQTRGLRGGKSRALPSSIVAPTKARFRPRENVYVDFMTISWQSNCLQQPQQAFSFKTPQQLAESYSATGSLVSAIGKAKLIAPDCGVGDGNDHHRIAQTFTQSRFVALSCAL